MCVCVCDSFKYEFLPLLNIKECCYMKVWPSFHFLYVRIFPVPLFHSILRQWNPKLWNGWVIVFKISKNLLIFLVKMFFSFQGTRFTEEMAYLLTEEWDSKQCANMCCQFYYRVNICKRFTILSIVDEITLAIIKVKRKVVSQ